MENKFWKDLSDESKKDLRLKYNSQQDNETSGFWMKSCMEALFGKENLKDVIGTWDDVIDKKSKYIDSDYFVCPYISGNTDGIVYPREQTSSDIIAKNVAAFKIYKLIELGYGGVITNEEWENPSTNKYCIHLTVAKDIEKGYKIGFKVHNSTKHFIAFHTQEQMTRFMSYPENIELIKKYYMF